MHTRSTSLQRGVPARRRVRGRCHDPGIAEPWRHRYRTGVWAVASAASDAGGWRSINRVGLPMLPLLFTLYNEILGEDLKAVVPLDDYATCGELVAKEIAGVVRAYGIAEDPDAYGRPWRTSCYRTSCPTRSECRRPLAAPAGTGGRRPTTPPKVMFTLAANTPIAVGIGKDSVTANERRPLADQGGHGPLFRSLRSAAEHRTPARMCGPPRRPCRGSLAT
jgi:hypothetical protein